MWKNANWRWVRDWAGRVFMAAFLLTVFLTLTASPVLRPGGVIDVLPRALLIALAVAIPVTAITAAALAQYSDGKGGRHDS